MLLASGSKDASVRLWKFTTLKGGKESQDTTEKGDAILKLKSVIFQVSSDKEDITLSVSLDAILAGHEGLVSGVHWARTITRGKKEIMNRTFTQSFYEQDHTFQK